MLCCTMHCQWVRKARRRGNFGGFLPWKYIAYRNDARGRPSHGKRQHVQNIWYRSGVWFRRYPHRQTHRHTVTILLNNYCEQHKYKTCSCHSHLRLTHQTYLTTNDLCCNAIINISKPLLHNSLHTFHFQCCSYLPDFTVFCANLWCNYKKMQW